MAQITLLEVDYEQTGRSTKRNHTARRQYCTGQALEDTNNSMDTELAQVNRYTCHVMPYLAQNASGYKARSGSGKLRAIVTFADWMQSLGACLLSVNRKMCTQAHTGKRASHQCSVALALVLAGAVTQ